MATRIGAKFTLSLSSKLSPEIWKRFRDRRKVRDVKKLFEDIEEALKRFVKADKDVNIDAVNKAVTRIIDDALSMEEDFAVVTKDTQVFQYKGLKFLNKLNKELLSVIKNLKGDNPAKAKLGEFLKRYQELCSSLQEKLDDMAQMYRRETIGRYQIKDAMMFRGYILQFYSLRKKLRYLAREENRAEHSEHKMVQELHDLLKGKKSPEKIADQLLANLSKFDAALKKVTKDAFFITNLETILRHRLEDYMNDLKSHISRLQKDGFPEHDVEKFVTGIKEFETQFSQDLDDEYAAAREHAHQAVVAKIGDKPKVRKAA